MPEIIPYLHPLLAHFPIALISVSAFFHVATKATRGKARVAYCTILPHTTLWLGALAALFVSSALNVIRQAQIAMKDPETKRAWGGVELVNVKSTKGE